MGTVKAVAELFKGRRFDREVIILCVGVTAITPPHLRPVGHLTEPHAGVVTETRLERIAW